MQRKDFYALCESLMISPHVALENEALNLALIKGNDEEVKRILTEEF